MELGSCSPPKKNTAPETMVGTWDFGTIGWDENDDTLDGPAKSDQAPIWDGWNPNKIMG